MTTGSSVLREYPFELITRGARGFLYFSGGESNIMEVKTFLGKPVDYWYALQQHADSLEAPHLISEIATLQTKVSYYESRIHQLNAFMKLNLEVKQEN